MRPRVCLFFCKVQGKRLPTGLLLSKRGCAVFLAPDRHGRLRGRRSLPRHGLTVPMGELIQTDNLHHSFWFKYMKNTVCTSTKYGLRYFNPSKNKDDRIPYDVIQAVLLTVFDA